MLGTLTASALNRGRQERDGLLDRGAGGVQVTRVGLTLVAADVRCPAEDERPWAGPSAATASFVVAEAAIPPA